MLFFCHCRDWQSQSSFTWNIVARKFIQVWKNVRLKDKVHFWLNYSFKLNKFLFITATCVADIRPFLTVWLCEWKFEPVGHDINRFKQRRLLLKLTCIKRFDTVIMFPVGVSGIKCWPMSVVPLSAPFTSCQSNRPSSRRPRSNTVTGETYQNLRPVACESKLKWSETTALFISQSLKQYAKRRVKQISVSKIYVLSSTKPTRPNHTLSPLREQREGELLPKPCHDRQRVFWSAPLFWLKQTGSAQNHLQHSFTFYFFFPHFPHSPGAAGSRRQS